MNPHQPLSQLKLVFFTLVFLLLFFLIGCAPAATANDTDTFCGVWKREFSPFDPNYHLLKSLENRGAELGVGPLTFEPLMELFYVERTGIDTAMVYDRAGRYPGKVEFKTGAGFVLVFGTADRNFQCTVDDDRIKAAVTERASGEAGTMDFSVRRPLEGEAGLWKDR